MKHVNKGLALMFLAVSGLLICRAQAQTIQGVSPTWNDNSLIAVQKEGGNPHKSGDVKIKFYGHDAFTITSLRGLTVLVDPWRNDPTGRYPQWFLKEFPAIPVDVVLSTHAHFDHDGVERPRGLIVLERLVGHFQLGDVAITGIAEKHKCEPAPVSGASDHSAAAAEETCPPNNVLAFDNAIEIIETGGMRIAIWGDNRPQVPASVESYLQHLDLLILPVPNVVTPSEAEAILRKFAPHAVIPSHYFVTGLTTKDSGMAPVDAWVSAQEKQSRADVRRLSGAELMLNPALLKAARGRIYYFGDHIAQQ